MIAEVLFVIRVRVTVRGVAGVIKGDMVSWGMIFVERRVKEGEGAFGHGR